MSREPRHYELTPRGKFVAAVAGLACGGAWLTGEPSLRLAASLLSAPLLVDFMFKTRLLDGVRLRMGALRVEAGRTFRQRIEVTNTSSRGLHDVNVTEPRMSSYRRSSLLASLQGNARAELALLGRSRQRSHLVERSFELDSHDPFGLVRVRRRIQIEADVVTEPARREVEIDAPPTARDGDPDARQNDRRHGYEFYSLREYAEGDDIRSVHAKRSAALGTLVSSLRRGQNPNEVVVVLDLRRSSRLPVRASRRHFEHGLSACASLLERLAAEGVVTRCFTIGQNLREERIANAYDLEEFFTFLSEVEPADVAAESVEMELIDAEVYYWIPAGGHLDDAGVRTLGDRVVLVGAPPK